MSYEENNPPDIDIADVFRILKPIFSDLILSEISFLYHGSYNVYTVKGKYIFKFPDKHFRNMRGTEMISNEVRTLNSLKENVSFKIPNPIFVSTKEEELYIGYEKIEGISLSRCIERMTKNQKLRVATQIGKILSELHSENLLSLALPESTFSMESFKLHWYKWFDRINEIVFPLLSENQKGWIKHLFENYFGNEKNFDFKPSISHCDFDTSNIIINPLIFQIQGIIDFEETKLYDPAVDLLFFAQGMEFMNELFKNYKIYNYNDLKERMQFFYDKMGLNYLVFGIENRINEMIKFGISLLIKRME
jgi:tRNA A-37 threonylcarbamoyl transferase component Bud32